MDIQLQRVFRLLVAAALLMAPAFDAWADYQTMLKQAKRGVQSEQLELGYSHMYGYKGVPKDSREAMRWLTAAQKGGGPLGRRASVNLGIMHGNRLYGYPDGAKSLRLLEAAAVYPDMIGKMARMNLGVMHTKPPEEATMPTNYDKALFWYFAARESSAQLPAGSGFEDQIDTAIRRLMWVTSESAVEIRGRAVEWVRRVERSN